MRAVIRALGFPENQFTRQETVEAHAPEDFRVVIHREVFPKIITSSRTKKWDSQPIATEQIIQVADMDGCESLCMTHFAFILGKFPEEALYQCMREAKQAIGCTHLKKVVVDVDEKFVALAVAINAQLDFAHQHGVTDSRVRFAEAGSSHFQFLLANELLVKSEHNDRVVHALKWVILAALIKGGNNEKIEKSKVVFAMDALLQSMNPEQQDQAWTAAEEWVAKKMTEYEHGVSLDVVPEFKSFVESCGCVPLRRNEIFFSGEDSIH